MRYYLVLLLVSFSLYGYAQRANEIKAYKLYKKSKDMMQNHKFKEACRMLDEAYTLYPQPHILYRKAECLEAMDKPEEALKVLESIVTDSRRLRTKVRSNISRLKLMLKKPVRVTIITPKSGALVTVDGKKQCTSPCTMQLPRGKHIFKASMEGFQTVEISKNITGFTGKVVKIPLKEIKENIDIALSKVPEGLKLLIDGKLIDTSYKSSDTSWRVPLTLGRHVLTAVAQGYSPCVKEFIVVKKNNPVVNCDLSKGFYWTTNKIIGWSLVGGGVLLTGLGAFLIADYYKDKSYAETNGYVMSSNKNIFGGIALGAGVAALGTSVYFLVFKKDKKAEQKTSFIIAPSYRGISAAATFTF